MSSISSNVYSLLCGIGPIICVHFNVMIMDGSKTPTGGVWLFLDEVSDFSQKFWGGVRDFAQKF